MSTKNPSPTPTEEPKAPQPGLFLSIIFSEGGFSLLIVLPLVVLYYLTLSFDA